MFASSVECTHGLMCGREVCDLTCMLLIAMQGRLDSVGFEPKVAVVGTPHRGMLAAVQDIFVMTCKEMLTATACAEERTNKGHRECLYATLQAGRMTVGFWSIPLPVLANPCQCCQ